MLDEFLKLIPEKISTWWLAPLLGLVFGAWVFLRRQKELEVAIEESNQKTVRLEAALEHQKKSNELLHQGMLELQQNMEQLDALLADARSQIRAVADSIVIRNPYAEDSLVFLMVHGPAAHRIAKMRVDLHGSQAGDVFLSRQTSIFPSHGGENRKQKHQKRLDTKSGFQSKNILTKPLLKFGNELVGVVQFLNEGEQEPFTTADEAKIESICVKMALVVANFIADPATLVQLGVVLDPHISNATILFTDITNSDVLFQTLPVADATAMVDEYLERLSAIGVKHGARIDKYMGDGMMLSFETNGLQNARQALNAAILMQEEFQSITREWQRLGYDLETLDHRIGIASGPVYGRRMGYGVNSAFTIMGAPVNLAAHLCEQARTTALCILLCESTKDGLGSYVPAGRQLEQLDLTPGAVYQVGLMRP